MKHRIRTNALQDLINLAFEGQAVDQKVLVNIEDENGRIVKTVAVRLSHDPDDDTYVVEWVP